MFDWLKKALKRKAKPRANARTYDMRTESWGDNVEWFDVQARRIVGWCDPRPVVGDIVKSPMQSGRVGLFVITEIKLCRDPVDMFFATVEAIGYDEEQGPYRWGAQHS